MTKANRLKIYESFFHRINLHCLTMRSDKVADAVSLIDAWSYAHRSGNGELTDAQQKKQVEHVINRMKEFK